MKKNFSYPLFITALFLIQTISSWAGGVYLWEAGTPDAGYAAAGRAAIATDASTAFGNPAGMMRLDRSELLIGAMPIVVDLRFESGPSSTNTGGNGGQAGGVLPGVGSYYVHHPSEDWRFGISIMSYSGSAFEYEPDWVGRYFTKELSLVTVNVIPTVAYRVSDHFSVGGGPIIQFARMKGNIGINGILDVVPDGNLELEDKGSFGFGGI